MTDYYARVQESSLIDPGASSAPPKRSKPGPRPILLEVGSGELIDKLTILQIKAEQMVDAAKRSNVCRELAVLEAARIAYIEDSPELVRLEAELKRVNLALWRIEDEIRTCESLGFFGPDFIALARAVYKTNDQRASIKRQINILTGATVVEEKSYGDAPPEVRRG